jgi:hypothetical protein
LRSAGFLVSKANNALHAGIAAVTSRLRHGTLRVQAGACPNLLAEAGLYRYADAPNGRKAEAPVDEHNHALAVLRYLILRIDARQLARAARTPRPDPTPNAPAPPAAPAKKRRPWLRLDNEALWTRLSGGPSCDWD